MNFFIRLILFVSSSISLGNTARTCYSCPSCLPTSKNQSNCNPDSDTCRQTLYSVNGIKYVQRSCDSLAICEAYKLNPVPDNHITANGPVQGLTTSCCSDDLCNSEENINSVQTCYHCAYCSILDRTIAPCGSNSDSCRQTSFISNGVTFVQRSCETTAQCDLFRAFPQAVLANLAIAGGVASNVITSCCKDNLCNASNYLSWDFTSLILILIVQFIV
ncbi:unnamed protein product [Brachionus calyciflorus]|uniref:UPAR/Ly6 domain-containing protein n=1 Tax=Brachionus calyciflorus TaxID=104777 RepID=A0A814MBK1_9BILA|nr:unnamed protein product [Brachionus calyciflorus]